MLKKISGIFIVSAILFFSCKTDDATNATGSSSNSTELAKLKGKVRSLEFQINNKDSLLNESIETFNEIQNNLAKISNKESEIRLKTKEGSLTKESKSWILQEIRNINFLRSKNSSKIKQLNQQLKSKNIHIKALQKMIDRLTLKVQAQNEQITALQDELANLDAEYAKLLDAYQEQTLLNYATLKSLNKAYYVYGTMKELKANNVIVQEGGFIGIGKNTLLKDDFNEQYFTAIDRRKVNTIKVVAKKINFITDHPSSSYEIIDNGNTKTINIKDIDAFWKISRYLVILVK